ncbi:MAG: 2'-deoxycytidine 5'-triphosphate deaminase [Candidatus Nitrospinota bacterium M3_3B_026]
MTRAGKQSGGVLPSQELRRLVDKAKIVPTSGKGSVKDNIQPASIDLTLGPKAYRLQSSFLPQSDTVENKMKDLIMYEVDLDRGGILEREAVYLIPLNESLNLTGTGISGKTNPKSSTGRLDVFTRVITDLNNRFEDIVQDYFGHLYLEVVPRSFTIKVRSGMRLNQLRLFRVTEEPSAAETGISKAYSPNHIAGGELRDLYEKEKLLFYGSEEPIEDDFHIRQGDGLLMGVDLADPSGDDGPIGYKAKKNSQVIDLEKIGEYDADDFWEAIYPPKNGRLILEPEEFYIFASKERIRVPLSCAAEMVEFDSGSGELRTHYAGFFDPGFGYGKAGEIKGTKAVLEVRPHDVPFIIEDGQILFKMRYERMVEKPGIWYGKEIGSNYYDQALRLSKQFRQG